MKTPQMCPKLVSISRLQPNGLHRFAYTLCALTISLSAYCVANAQTNPLTPNVAALPQSKPSQGNPNFLYRAKTGDTPESIAFDYLVEASKKAAREKFYSLNRIEPKEALKPVAPNHPFTIPVESMYLKPTVAHVVSLVGSAQMSHANTKNIMVNVGINDKIIEEGTTIKTATGGFVNLRFPDNSVLSVTPNSEVLIESLKRYAGSDIFKIQVLLVKGRVESDVKPFTSQASDYSVRSRRLTTAVRGTFFNVNDDPDGNASLEVFDGAVSLKDRTDKTLTVPVAFGSYVKTQSASDLIPLIPAPKWQCDPEGTLLTKKLPLVFTKTPSTYRLDLFSAPSAYLQISTDNPVLPSDLPVGDYRVSVRGIDEHGLQGFGGGTTVSVRERVSPSFIRWVVNESTRHWIQQETPDTVNKVFFCESS